jgi:hypothetical protein
MAKRDAAVHAARPLLLKFALSQGQMKLPPIVDPLQRLTVGRQFPLKFHKSGRFSHFFSSR